MKSTLNTVFLVFALNAASAQTFDLLISSPLNEMSFNAIEQEDAYIIGIGVGDPVETYLFKVSLEGNVQDSLLIEYPGYNIWLAGMLPFDLQNFYIYGSVVNKITEVESPFLAKLNSDLQFNFFSIYDTLISESFLEQCIINKAGNLFCIGQKYEFPRAIFFCEMDTQGEVIKTSKIDSAWYGGQAHIIELPSIDAYHITNRSNNGITQIKRSTLEADSLGFENSSMDFMSAKALTDSTYVVTGEFSWFPNFIFSVGFRVYNQYMQLTDSVDYHRADTNDFSAIQGLDFLSKDSIFIGFTKNFEHQPDYFFADTFTWYGLYNLKADGSLNWQKYYGGDCNYHLRKVLATRDGGALLIGQRWDWKNNSIKEKDVYIIKVDSEGNFIPKVGIGINERIMQAKSILVYPNPATDKINIQTGLMRDLHFQLFDARGRLLNEKTLNSSSESIDISTLPGGIYFYKTEGRNGFYESGKIVKE